MTQIVQLLNADKRVSDYKIHIRRRESYELFFVKGSLETVRCTDTCDKEVTVYADHGDFKGEAQFFVYPSTTEEELLQKIDEAVNKALLINNKFFSLPGNETGSFAVESNFSEYDPADLAARIANAVFESNQVPNGSLNSVEIFVTKHTEHLVNSRGLDKTQVRYGAMAETIPTYNGDQMSVELYEQYNFSSLDEKALRARISSKMEEVRCRYEAVKPDDVLDCPVVLNPEELSQLFRNIAYDLNYSSVYSHSNLYTKGDAIQKEIHGDPIGITMSGQVPGSVYSSCFDSDGLSLNTIRLVDGGKAVNYFGTNRFGQYLGETPTGNLSCMIVDTGSADLTDLAGQRCLEIVSMSGLQVDFYSDYIGGEIRLAYLHDGSSMRPVTGISISGKLSQVLSSLRLSRNTVVYNGYFGPDRAIAAGMKIF